MNLFLNPYTSDPTSPIYIGREGVTLNDKGINPSLANVQFTVHRDHKHFLKRIRPEVGTEAICMSILYKKLIEAMSEAGVDSPAALENFVTSCRITP